MNAPAVHQREGREGLSHPVFVNLEVVLRQIGDELILRVAHDRVSLHGIDVHPERGL